MTLKHDLARSRDFEMQTYLRSMQAMYETALQQNGDIYDIAFEYTDGFTAITPESIEADSRIIKVLRYAIAPSISQMKFGQLFGLSSTDRFERSKLTETSGQIQNLSRISSDIATFVTANLDHSRFLWVSDHRQDSPLAREYAKKWTCSLSADQNAQTAYRNWRKAQQEQAIVGELVRSKYIRSSFTGTLRARTDLGIGEYTQEIRVQGRTVQKADVVVRSKKDRRLVLIEAKAVGVELDSTKRIKECCNKAEDWRSAKKLENPEVVAVIAGFFGPIGIATLEASGVEIVWEHNLAELGRFL